MSRLELHDIVTEEQELLYSFDSVYFETHNLLTLIVNPIFSANDTVSDDISFNYISISRDIGTIESFNDIVSGVIEADVTDSIVIDTLDDLVYGPFLINYRSTVKYEIFDYIAKATIDIPYDIRFLGERNISDSKIYRGFSIESELFEIIDSAYSGILNSAVKAKHIFISQNFYLDIGRKNTFRIKESKYSILSFEIFKQRNITKSKYPDILMSYYSKILFNVIDVIEREYVQYDRHVVTNTSEYVSFENDIYLGPFEPLNVSLSDVYSKKLYIHSKHSSFNDLVYKIAKSWWNASLDNFVSERIEVIGILAPSGNYSVKTLNSYYSEIISPSVSIYEDGNLSEMKDGYYTIATWNDYRDLSEFRSNESNIRYTIYIPEDINGMTTESLKYTMYVVQGAVFMLQDLVSAPSIIEVGYEMDFFGNGLNHVFYRYDYQLSPSETAGWLTIGSRIVSLRGWNFFDIELTESLGRAVQIQDTKYSVILMDWNGVKLDNNNFMIPPVGSPNYFIVRNISTNDFVMIALSTSGGSVLHMHKNGVLPEFNFNRFNQSDDDIIGFSEIDMSSYSDAYNGEYAARIVSSYRYTKNAETIFNVINGTVYPQYKIDRAINFLKKNEESALFFSSYDYSPYQISDIIHNKSRAVITNDFFSSQSVLEYNDVKFLHKDENASSSDNIEFDYVKTHKYAFNSLDSEYIISSTINGVIIGHDSKYIRYMDGCSIFGNCQVVYISGDVPLYVGTVQFSILNHDSPKFTDKDYFTESEIRYGENLSFENANFKLVKITVDDSYLDMYSGTGHVDVTIGNKYSSIYYDGRIVIGLEDLSGIVFESSVSNFTLGSFSSILHPVKSDFYFKLTFRHMEFTFSDLEFDAGYFSINKGFTDLSQFYDKVESFWMKMFFPISAGRSIKEDTIMSFLVSEEDFSKNISFPYEYVDDYVSGTTEGHKGGSPSLSEKKIKDSDIPPEPSSIGVPGHRVCGDDRNSTYLQYYGFNHIVNYEDTNIFVGNYPFKFKENINSPYLKISASRTILPGTRLSDAESLSRSMEDAILSHIDNLGEVYDWKVEEFTITREDLGGDMISKGDFVIVDEQFTKSLKFMVSTLGQDRVDYEEEVKKQNPFPDFPDRPIKDDYLKTFKVSQFIDIFPKETDV